MRKRYLFIGVVLLMIAAGCSGSGSNSWPVKLSSAKAITAFSLNGVAATIDEAAKTIAVTMPYGTAVTALVATFETTGKSVKVGSTVQESGTTANDFNDPVVYTVTAADATTQAYTVTVTVVPSSGSLDISFGTGGIVTTSVGASYDFAIAGGIQSDGKIVAAGHSFNGSTYDVALVRYKTDGSLDTAFGTGGKVKTPVGSLNSVTALGIQSDGKILVAGSFDTCCGSPVLYYSNIILMRYNTDGGLDSSFGSGGKVTTAIGNVHNFATALGIQPDGRIVVAGYYANHSGPWEIALVRYNIDGSFDSSFGTSGKVTTSLGASGYSHATALSIQSDGRLVVAGYYFNGSNHDFALVRYNADGSLDTSFGTGGKVITPVGSSDDKATALGIQSDGKILVAGYSDNNIAVVRYKTDGSLDISFGTGGKVTTSVGSSSSYASGLKIQSDGKIVVSGYYINGINAAEDPIYDMAMVRYNANGSLDTSFGTGGKVTTPFGNSDDFANSLVIQSDGKIVILGYYENDSKYDFALVRYWP